MRTYEGMLKYADYTDRLNYLSLKDENYTSPRTVSMAFYKSKPWKDVRRLAIERDLGCDLACIDVGIDGPILVHHIDPITEEDIIRGDPKCLDLNNLVCTSKATHNAIHYGETDKPEYCERKAGDTKLW